MVLYLPPYREVSFVEHVIRVSSVMVTRAVILVTFVPMVRTPVMRMHSAPKPAPEDLSAR